MKMMNWLITKKGATTMAAVSTAVFAVGVYNYAKIIKTCVKIIKIK